jgi:hypothetical protein
VVNHLVGMNLVLVAMLSGHPLPERGADRLGDDAAGAFRRSSAALLDAADPASLERVQETRLGAASGGQRLQWRIVDLVTHGWDLAQARSTCSPRSPVARCRRRITTGQAHPSFDTERRGTFCKCR